MWGLTGCQVKGHIMTTTPRVLTIPAIAACLALGAASPALAAPTAQDEGSSHTLQGGWSASAEYHTGYYAGASATAKITSLGAVNDSTYGPSEKMLVSVRNTGTVRTRYLDVQLPDGSVFVDDEGQQTFIGNCRPYALPLSPGEYTTCQMYRLLTDEELAMGRTFGLDLAVVLFGDNGPKSFVHKDSVEFDPNMFRD